MSRPFRCWPQARSIRFRWNAAIRACRCALLGLLEGKDVLAGVIDVATDAVETPEQVAAVIEDALRFVPAGRLFPCTNCGMAPMSVEVAAAKLVALGQGAALARRRLGALTGRLAATLGVVSLTSAAGLVLCERLRNQAQHGFTRSYARSPTREKLSLLVTRVLAVSFRGQESVPPCHSGSARSLCLHG